MAIFAKDSRAFVMAIDHPLSMPSPELADAASIISSEVAGGVDAFLASYGCIRHFRDLFGGAGTIMRADGGATRLDRASEPLRLLHGAVDAEAIGADAVMCMGFPGGSFGGETLSNVASLASDAHASSLLAGAEMLPYGFEHPDGIDTRSVENVAFACRLGAELGADFIKTELVGGRRFREVVRGCFVPVLVLGGGASKTPEELLVTVSDAMEAGASGVIMGRNIARSGNITALCRAIALVIHEGMTVESAISVSGLK